MRNYIIGNDGITPRFDDIQLKLSGAGYVAVSDHDMVNVIGVDSNREVAAGALLSKGESAPDDGFGGARLNSRN